MKEETILVVDDNREIVYSIGELLKYEGYHVLTPTTAWRLWRCWRALRWI